MGERAVLNHAWPGWAGVYLLANTPDGIVRYVGRSDADVQARLLQHAARGEYRFFWVEHKKDAVDAFLRECGLFHYYTSTLENRIHPRRPAGCDDACPRCSFYD